MNEDRIRTRARALMARLANADHLDAPNGGFVGTKELKAVERDLAAGRVAVRSAYRSARLALEWLDAGEDLDLAQAALDQAEGHEREAHALVPLPRALATTPNPRGRPALDGEMIVRAVDEARAQGLTVAEACERVWRGAPGLSASAEALKRAYERLRKTV